MKRHIILILLIAVLLFSSCDRSTEASSVQNTNQESTTATQTNETATDAASQEGTALETETTPEPTATISPQDAELKYIFYIIGDGMGEAHVALGEMATRIMHQDMDAKAIWEDYDYKHNITAGINSANGGTALACGLYPSGIPIGIDNSGNELYTIMDRAKENGFATGVLTNSFLLDATPATYLAHADTRRDIDDIAKDISQTDVDFLGGGGIAYLISDEMSDIAGERDVEGLLNRFVNNDNYGESLMERFPDMIIGSSSRDDLQELEESGDYPDKLLVLPYNIQFFCQGDTSLERYYDQIDKSVDLADLTKAGIGVLSQDEDGFVFMIEAAIIDKLGHDQAISWTAQEMLDLDETLKVVKEFYDAHPYETLIILTADHETGYYTYSDEKYEKFYELTDFQMGSSCEEVYSFLKDNWDFSADLARLEKAYQVYEDSPYLEDMDNIGPIAGEIAAQTLYSLGIKSRTGQHSTLPVPLFTHGKMAEEFEDIEKIAEIPIKICEIMGWKALPEIIE